MPSVRKHGLSAVLLLALATGLGWLWLDKSAKNKAAPLPKAEVTLPAPPAEVKEETPDLPDLLSEDVPKDVNPTERMDELMEMAGDTQKPAKPPTSFTHKSVTRTGTGGPILINGKAWSGRKTITDFKALPPAPIDGLSHMGIYGPIPSPNAKGLTPFQAYAKPFSPEKDKHYLSLVIGGLGLNPMVTRKAINELPGEVTLSFAAEAPGLQGWIDQARAHGHEVLIELPMQADSQINRALIKSATPEDNLKNLDYLLSRGQGYFAVTNYGGDDLLKAEAALAPLLKALKSSGLGFVYDGNDKTVRLKPVAKKQGLPALSANGYLDENSQENLAIVRRINSIIADSYEQIPVGMGFAYPGTIEGVQIWLASKDDKLALAPVSYVLKTR